MTVTGNNPTRAVVDMIALLLFGALVIDLELLGIAV